MKYVANIVLFKNNKPVNYLWKYVDTKFPHQVIKDIVDTLDEFHFDFDTTKVRIGDTWCFDYKKETKD
jgi:hypothetical protein